MKRRFMIKRRFLLLFLFISIFVLSSTFHISSDSVRSVRSKKTEEMINFKNINHHVTSKSTSEGNKLKEFLDSQVIDGIEIETLSNVIKSMQLLFFRLIIILSFYQFFLYIKRWIIIMYQIRNKFYILRYLQLKDGKKSLLSIQFSF